MSDLHGTLPYICDEFDLMLICGDVCPANQPHVFYFQFQWMKSVFATYIKDLPFKDENSKVFMVFGNHDFFDFANDEVIHEIEKSCDGRLKILNLETETFSCDGKSVKVFGSPWCHQFYDWAFMTSDDMLRKKYDKYMPEDADIFISHDAPYELNELGAVHYNDGSLKKDVGNKPLRDIILERKPKYFFCGHIHTGNHDFKEINEFTKAANVSILNERYEWFSEPLKFEI